MVHSVNRRDPPHKINLVFLVKNRPKDGQRVPIEIAMIVIIVEEDAEVEAVPNAMNLLNVEVVPIMIDAMIAEVVETVKNGDRVCAKIVKGVEVLMSQFQ